MNKILVVNQPGSNRGDEAACRGMFYGLKHFIPDAEFTMLTIFPLSLDGIEKLTLLNNLPLHDLKGPKAVSSILRYLIGFYTNFNTTPLTADVFAAYRQADLIISTPGGPYIGDLYPWWELEMLFHILLGTLTSSPVMIYAPSMGPFERKFSNFWRKRVLNRVDLITLRESISAQYLAGLGIQNPHQYITIDSALQRPIDANLGDVIFAREGFERGKTYIGFVPLELGRFQNDERKMKYIELLVHTMRLLVERFKADLVLFPQGYGAWRDRPFIESLVSIAGVQHRSHILPETCNSDEQQALIGKMRAFVSFRYHPSIFSLRQFVPCVNVAYEHKIRGFMQSLGMEEFCLDMETVTAVGLVKKLEEIWQEQNAIEKRLSPRLKELERLSLKNSFLASLLLKYRSQPRSVSLNEFIDQQLNSTEWWTL